MAVMISSGVYFRELDLSTYTTNLATTSVGLVGLAKKGPVNKPILTTNMNQWIEKFGTPSDDYPFSGLAADQYFDYGNTLFMVRVIPKTENGFQGALHGRHQEYELVSPRSAPSGVVYRLPDNETNLRFDFDFSNGTEFTDKRLTTAFAKTKEAVGIKELDNHIEIKSSYVGKVVSSTSSTVIVVDQSLTNIQADDYIKIVAGTGTGQIRKIESIGDSGSGTSDDEITVTEAFLTIPDETSKYEICGFATNYANQVFELKLGTGSNKVSAHDDPLVIFISTGMTITGSGQDVTNTRTQVSIINEINEIIANDERYAGKIIASYNKADLSDPSDLNVFLKLISSYDIYVLRDGTVTGSETIPVLPATANLFGFNVTAPTNNDLTDNAYVSEWTRKEIEDQIKSIGGNEKGLIAVRFNNNNNPVFYSHFKFRIVKVINNCDAIYEVLGTGPEPNWDVASGSQNTDGHSCLYGIDYEMSVKENYNVGASANTMTIQITTDTSVLTDYKIVFPSSKFGTFNASSICKYLNDDFLFDPNKETNWNTTDYSASGSGSTSGSIFMFDGKPKLTFFPKDGKIVMVSQDATYEKIDLGHYYPAITAEPDTLDYDTLGSILGYGVGDDADNEGTVIEGNYGSEFGYTWFPVVDNPGKWGNEIRVRVWYSYDTSCNISIDEWNDFRQDWEEVERHSNVVWAEDQANETFKYIGDIDTDYLMLDARANMYNETDPDPIYGQLSTYPQPGTYYMSGGNDGDFSGDAIIDEIVGTPEKDAYTGWATGLQAFADPEQIDVNTIIAPYFSQFPEVWTAGITLCTARNEAYFVIDTPQGLSAQQVTDWANGSYGLNETSINSSFAGMYWPWCKYYDVYNDKQRWVPTSGLIAGQYAYNDYVSSVHYSAAGLNRGRLINVLNIEYDASPGERDMLTQNGVNCIVDFLKEGVTIWDDITTQRKPSALKECKVRRGLNYVKKVCATVAKYYVFEPNDTFTQNHFKSVISDFLATQNRAFYAWEVKCDSSTQTNLGIDNGVMRCVIWLQFVRSVKKVQLDFVLLKTGGIAVLDEIG